MSRSARPLTLQGEIDAILTDANYVKAVGESRINAIEGITARETSKYIEFYGKEKDGNGDTYGKYFSNCVLAPIVIDGTKYASSEHYFQISKFTVAVEEDSSYGQTVPGRDDANIHAMHLMSPIEVAKHGRTYRQAPIRKDWNDVRVKVMFQALIAKFELDEFGTTGGSRIGNEFGNALLATRDLVLIERAPIDAYWAINDKGVGENMLGVLLMVVRNRLRHQ